MNAFLLSAYILVWPVIAAGILVMLIAAVIKDHKAAKKAGRDMI